MSPTLFTSCTAASERAPYFLLEISDILATFGAFMAVLIAIEVFVNIVTYLSDDALHIDIVLATAYMAVLRKIIILDYKEVSPDYVYATAALAVALAVGYWLTKKPHLCAQSREKPVIDAALCQHSKRESALPGFFVWDE